MALQVEFVVYEGENQDAHIAQAVSFINANLCVQVVPHVTYLKQTPSLHYYGGGWNCYILAPWNVPQSDIDQLPANACIFMLLWKAHDMPICMGGASYGLGIRARPTDSMPYDNWWWTSPSDTYGHNLTGAAAIFIHEFHHMLESIWYDVYHNPLAMSTAEHTYGVTIPHMDRMEYFTPPAEQTAWLDQYQWSEWAYQQISPEMCRALDYYCLYGLVRPVSIETDPNNAVVTTAA